MRILQRNLKRATDKFLFISRKTNILLLKFRCSIFIGVRIIKEMPASVASGTPCIKILLKFHFELHFELCVQIVDYHYNCYWKKRLPIWNPHPSTCWTVKISILLHTFDLRPMGLSTTCLECNVFLSRGAICTARNNTYISNTGCFFLLDQYAPTKLFSRLSANDVAQCFSTSGPRPGTGPWHLLYRVARSSPGICHFSFLNNFHEYMFYSGNILSRKNIRECVEKLRTQVLDWGNYNMLQDLISPVIDN